MTESKEEYPLIFSFRGAALKAELFLGIIMLIIMAISTALIMYMQLLFSPGMEVVDIPFVRCILVGAGVSIF